jgi:peptide subunit release factor 1 (eRF1)
LQWHLKRTADTAYHLFNDRSCDGIVTLAESRVTALLNEFLHESLKPKIIARIENAPAAEPRDRTQLIENALRNHRNAREVKAIEDLANYKPGDELIFGLHQVIPALNLFFVRKMLVSETLREKGSVCREHHYISLRDGECPFDNTKLLPLENVIDEIVEIARFHGVDVLMIEQRHDLMAKYNGIAAVKYRGLNVADQAA